MRLSTNAGNGASSAIAIRNWGNREIEHIYTIYAWGTFDGAVVKIEVSPDNGTTWFDTGILMNAQKMQNIEFRGPLIRANISGGGAGVSLNVLVL